MLEVSNLKKKYRKLEVLKKISFKADKGEVISIIGPSGCGKSTLLRCINMLEVPTGGKIIFDGQDITKKGVNLSKIRQKIGMVFQQFNLFMHLTVLENIILAPVNLGLMTRDEAVKEAESLLKDIDLLDKKDNFPHELSGGQKQRVAIARTLIMKPEIILFDEPTSALDPEMVGEVLDLIKSLINDNITIIIVSHEMNFIKNCATRVLFLEDGLVKYDASPKEIFDDCQNERLREFLNKSNYLGE